MGASRRHEAPRSISPAVRTSIGVSSIPDCGATDLIAAIGHPSRLWRDPMTAPRLTSGAISLSSANQFGPSEFEIEKTGHVAAGRARLSTKPAPTGSVACGKTIGTVRVTCCKAPTLGALNENDVRRKRANSAADLRIRRHRPAPARVDPHVAADVHPNSASPCRNAVSRASIPDRPEQGQLARLCVAHAPARGPLVSIVAMPPSRTIIPAASWPFPGSGDGIVMAQTSTLIGAEPGFATATGDAGRSPLLGHSRRFWPGRGMSASPPIATKQRTFRDVRKVPQARHRPWLYSITSSAR